MFAKRAFLIELMKGFSDIKLHIKNIAVTVFLNIWSDKALIPVFWKWENYIFCEILFKNILIYVPFTLWQR